MAAFFKKLWRELHGKAPYVWWVVVSLILIATEPFGVPGEITYGGRLLFWLPVLAGLILFASVMRVLAAQWLPNLSSWKLTAALTLINCLVLSPVLVALIARFSPLGPTACPSVLEIAMLIGSLSLGLFSLELTREGRYALMPVSVPVVEPGPPTARLLTRIEPEARGRLLAISVRDHYVDVQTSLGETSLLMRLADAISEAHPVEGTQVHRSHWVAWHAIEAVEREGSKIFLRLTHGRRVPVSKNHREKLQDRGMF